MYPDILSLNKKVTPLLFVQLNSELSTFETKSLIQISWLLQTLLLQKPADQDQRCFHEETDRKIGKSGVTVSIQSRGSMQNPHIAFVENSSSLMQI